MRLHGNMLPCSCRLSTSKHLNIFQIWKNNHLWNKTVEKTVETKKKNKKIIAFFFKRSTHIPPYLWISDLNSDPNSDPNSDLNSDLNSDINSDTFRFENWCSLTSCPTVVTSQAPPSAYKDWGNNCFNNLLPNTLSKTLLSKKRSQLSSHLPSSVINLS